MSSVQNNARTTQRGGVTGAGFVPGVSGNPGGRPLGLASRVRQLVGDDGQAIADYMFAVLTSETEKTSDRMAAATWLADRGFGRASHAAIDEAPRWPDFGEMELEDLTAIRDILAKYA